MNKKNEGMNHRYRTLSKKNKSFGVLESNEKASNI